MTLVQREMASSPRATRAKLVLSRHGTFLSARDRIVPAGADRADGAVSEQFSRFCNTADGVRFLPPVVAWQQWQAILSVAVVMTQISQKKYSSNPVIENKLFR
jgi:hypothetical protein